MTDNLDALDLVDLGDGWRCMRCELPAKLQHAYDAVRGLGDSELMMNILKRILAYLPQGAVFRGDADAEKLQKRLKKTSKAAFIDLGSGEYAVLVFFRRFCS